MYTKKEMGKKRAMLTCTFCICCRSVCAFCLDCNKDAKKKSSEYNLQWFRTTCLFTNLTY
uniref:Uncharacterized protein n=1 Tax=Rhizophora mucronata TaxID=61149 RepID=A0A2P2LQM2_RHIMU